MAADERVHNGALHEDALWPIVRGLWLLSFALVLPPPAQAGDWTVTPRLSIKETYSDNVNLAPSGDKDEDFVTTVNTGLSAAGEGGRVKLDLHYNLQKVVHHKVSGEDSLNHQLRAAGTAELVKRIVFVDVTGSASQRNVDNRGRLATDNISVTDNTTDVFTYSVSPYFVHRFGNYADSLVRTTFDSVDNGDAGGNSTSRSTSAQLSSGSVFSRMPWSLSYSKQRINNDEASSSEFGSATGSVSYVLNRKFRVNYSLGKDFNEFDTSQSESDGFRWNAGFTWTPTPRTSLTAGYGSRFFGSNYNFNLSHRSRKTTWTASYSEDTSTTRQQELERTEETFFLPGVNEEGELVFIGPFTREINIARLTQEVQVAKSFRGSVAVTGRRTTGSVSVFNFEREFQLSGEDERVFGGSATLRRKLSSRTTASASGSWQRSEFDVDGGEDTRWDLGVSLDHELGPDVSGSLDYRRAEQTSNVGDNEYVENRLSLKMNVSF